MATRNESTRKRFSNWLQCICCLNDTKTALHDHVVEAWKKEIMSWDRNIRIHLPDFFSCVSEGRVKVKYDNPDERKRNKKGKWICDGKHTYCNSILEKLLALQQNPGFNIVWNSYICDKLTKKGVEVESDDKEDYDMDDGLENIPRIETSLLTWKKDIMSLDKDIKHHIPRFLSCVSEKRIKIQSCEERSENGKNIDGRKTNENEKWFSDCEHSYCNDILEKLLALQNPDFNIVCEKPTKKSGKLKSVDDDNDSDESEDASKVETSLLALVCQMLFEVMGLMGKEQGASAEAVAEEIDYKDIFDDCTQEHIWCIANMFMQHGKATTKISNYGPENTDASMFFKMTKNCKLFEIENGNYLYDDIIHSRDLLHHSADNRVHQEEAEPHFKTMIDLLKAFPNEPKCVDAIQKIEKMLKETILSVSVPDENLKGLAEKALKLKKSALEVDREINRATGDSNDDISGLFKDTEEQIKTISNPQSKTPLNEGIKSIEDLKQESLDCKNRLDEMHKKITKLETENQTLKNESEEELKSKEEYKRETFEYKQRFDDIKEKAIKLENENEKLKDEMEKENESKEEYEREKLKAEQSLDDIKQKTMELENENEILKDQNRKEVKSKEDSKREKLEYEQRLVEMKQNTMVLENENKTLKDKNEKSIEDFKREKQEDKQRFDEMQQKLKELENENKTSAFLKKKVTNDSANAARKGEEEKDPVKHFENLTNVVKTFAHNREIASALTEHLNPLMNRIVEVASESDGKLKEKVFEVSDYEENKRKTSSQALKIPEKRHVEQLHDRQDFEALDSTLTKDDSQSHSHASATSLSSDVLDIPHDNATLQKYVRGHNESECNIICLRQLPSGEIIQTDARNHKLKKLNDKYKVISVCDLNDTIWDVCYIGNNNAVVGMKDKLQFVDVREGMVLTRSVDIDPTLKALACHGNILYGINHRTVYIYSAKGVAQRVLYGTTGNNPFYHIAVSDDGKMLYIASEQGLFTIDSSGNYLYTLTDGELRSCRDVCVDCNGHVLICGIASSNVFKIDSGGKKKLGIVADRSNDIENTATMHFNRQNNSLIIAGWSDYLTVIPELKPM